MAIGANNDPTLKTLLFEESDEKSFLPGLSQFPVAGCKVSPFLDGCSYILGALHIVDESQLHFGEKIDIHSCFS